MMKYMKKWQTQQKAVIILLLFYIPFHLWLTPGYWDDAVFAGVLEKYQFNLVQYTMDRYLTWSSRISIELLIPFLTSAPNFVWKTFNLLMIMLLYVDLRWTLKAVVRIVCISFFNHGTDGVDCYDHELFMGGCSWMVCDQQTA